MDCVEVFCVVVFFWFGLCLIGWFCDGVVLLGEGVGVDVVGYILLLGYCDVVDDVWLGIGDVGFVG